MEKSEGRSTACLLADSHVT